MAHLNHVQGPVPKRPLRRAVAGATTLLLSAGLLALPAGAQAATAVPLGTAGNFAILAGSGITNTMQTTISGDVGSSPTSAQTGFAACPAADCVTLTGGNHIDPDPNDAVTVGAKADLTLAYDDAAGQTPTQIATELAGATLAPGAYDSASGTFEIGGPVPLVLDGQNDPNAVFIFQTTTSLVTAAASSVSLMRGAQSCNVFWQVGSAATLGANSTFRGTILAHDDISLDAGVTVDGRLLAGEQASGIGAVTLIGDTIIRPTCAAAAAAPTPTPTPVETPTETTTTADAAADGGTAATGVFPTAAQAAAFQAADDALVAARAAAVREAAAERRADRRAARTEARTDARAARRAEARRQAAREARADRAAARKERRAAARRAARIGVPTRARQRPGFTG